MPEFIPVLNVSALDGTNGFRLDGDAVQDYAGRFTSGGGDVNGDGFTDFLIGSPRSLTGGIDRGLAWVVFGGASAPANQQLGTKVAAGGGYRFQGEQAGNQAGCAVSNAGDVNGDGFDDMLIGARYASFDSPGDKRGATYLVFGGAAKLEAFDAADGANDNRIALGNIATATGYRFDGEADQDFSGWSVSGAGDVNGDGIADLIVGAPGADRNVGGPGGNRSNVGNSYIVFGGANLASLDGDDGAIDGRIDLSQISAGQGLRIIGPAANSYGYSGVSVSAAGDVNGDGFADVLVGAGSQHPSAPNSGKGAVYLVFGRPQAAFAAASLDLGSLTGAEGTRFDGAAAGDQAGRAVARLGDVNADGFDDIAIGAPRADTPDIDSGAAYVVFGKAGWTASSDLSTLSGGNGFRIAGSNYGDVTGYALSAAGDVNGDGFADVLVSAHWFDRTGADRVGAVYVVFGKASGFSASIDPSSLDGDDGFRIEGAAASDFLGQGIAGSAGDINGDGFDDIVVGASGADNNGLSYSGSTYVIYGHRAETAVTRVGTALANKINGGKGDYSISGLGGNDTLIGWEGNDVIKGGEGNDIIDGGAGRDHVVLISGSDSIDGGLDRDLLDCRLLAGAVSINLLAGSFSNGADTITFVNIEDLRGTASGDTLVGSSSGNYLIGLAGDDSLNSRAGDDLLEGGLGVDTMIGGADNDRFIFRSVADSGTAAGTRDIVADFTVVSAPGSAFADRIDLHFIDAQASTAGSQAFSFIGNTAFGAEGQVRAFQSGANTIVEINTSSAAGAEMTIQLTNFTAANLTSADFIL